MNSNWDAIIVGTGLSGLVTALRFHEICPRARILVLSKSDPYDTNSAMAQGGMACVGAGGPDSIRQHITDTWECGGQQGEYSMIKKIIEDSGPALQWILRQGASFDLDSHGNLAMALEGGHRFPRVIHFRDSTGKMLVQTLMEKVLRCPEIFLIPGFQVCELLKNEYGDCAGVTGYFQDGKAYSFSGSSVILATGGCGQLFRVTTNPLGATGAGYALAARLGAEVKNMDWMQFHPTALFIEEDMSSSPLLTEALRGEGAHVLNQQQERFLFEYDNRGELAPRDIVCRAIWSEMKKSESSNVWLDLRPIGKQMMKHRFPLVYKTLEEYGYKPGEMCIPIAPAAHYQCGGVSTDAQGRSTIPGLYAVGEVACTGLHGANRLASNSLLEALVMGLRVAESGVGRCGQAGSPIQFQNDKNIPTLTFPIEEQMRVIRTLKNEMTRVFTRDQHLRIPEIQSWIGEHIQRMNQVSHPLEIDIRMMLDVSLHMLLHVTNRSSIQMPSLS